MSISPDRIQRIDIIFSFFFFFFGRKKDIEALIFYRRALTRESLSWGFKYRRYIDDNSVNKRSGQGRSETQGIGEGLLSSSEMRVSYELVLEYADVLATQEVGQGRMQEEGRCEVGGREGWLTEALVFNWFSAPCCHSAHTGRTGSSRVTHLSKEP